MDKELEQKIRSSLKCITERPWVKLTSKDVYPAVVSPGRGVIAMDIENEENADFIVNAPEWLPLLLDEIARLKQRIVELEK